MIKYRLDGFYVIHENRKDYPALAQAEDGSVNCPFCLEKHTHGVGFGHRLTHCTGTIRYPIIQLRDGAVLEVQNGYYVDPEINKHAYPTKRKGVAVS